MRRRQPGAELARDLGRLVRGEPADSSQQRSQIIAVDELHRDVLAPADIVDVVDATDVGVADLERRANLVEETAEFQGIAFEMTGKKFQRDGLAEFEIVGTINFAHSTAAEQPDNTIPIGDHRPGGETTIGVDGVESRFRRLLGNAGCRCGEVRSRR